MDKYPRGHCHCQLLCQQTLAMDAVAGVVSAIGSHGKENEATNPKKFIIEMIFTDAKENTTRTKIVQICFTTDETFPRPMTCHEDQPRHMSHSPIPCDGILQRWRWKERYRLPMHGTGSKRAKLQSGFSRTRVHYSACIPQTRHILILHLLNHCCKQGTIYSEQDSSSTCIFPDYTRRSTVFLRVRNS